MHCASSKGQSPSIVKCAPTPTAARKRREEHARRIREQYKMIVEAWLLFVGSLMGAVEVLDE